MSADRPRTFWTCPDAAGVVIEFEVKARVPTTRVEAVRAALGRPERVEAHADVYYQHPCRDLAQTDEAVRLSRRGDRVELTWKGPKLDATSKARREVVLQVDDEAKGRAFLEALGFARVAEVAKTRAVHHAAGFEVAFDEVPGLGAFVELERVLPDDAPREEAEREARALLDAWGLHETLRASYLELLLAR